MYEIELDPEIAESVCRISENLPEINFSKQLEEMALGVAECIQTTAPQLQSLIDQATCTIQMIQDAIPNIRCIQENLSREMPEFSKSITSLIQTLDFPAIQPEITREQLRDRLESMSEINLESAKASAVAAVNSVPKKEVRKPSVKKMLGVAFAVITAAIPTIDSAFSIADRFVDSKNGNQAVVNVYNVPAPKIDYYFEDKQTQKESKSNALQEQDIPVAIATPGTECNNK